MMIEYAAEVFHRPGIAQLLHQLAELENTVQRENNPKGDKYKRDQAEKAAEGIRDALIQKSDATVIYYYLKTTGVADADAFRTEWQKMHTNVDVWSQLPFGKSHPVFDGWLTPTIPDLAEFPIGSFVLNIPFELNKPYLSKDDQDFYIIDNPIQREKIFQLPMIRSTSWKGALRSALWQLDHHETDDLIIRLFGSPRAEEEDFIAGRLQFYTSFFNLTGLEIINPHDRKTKTGKNPILFETVKQGARSTFLLFYFPFDRVGEDAAETGRQAIEDLVVVTQGLRDMFTAYGFGAKTSSGFGVAANELTSPGSLAIKLHIAGSDEVLNLPGFNSLRMLVRQAEALERRFRPALEEQA